MAVDILICVNCSMKSFKWQWISWSACGADVPSSSIIIRNWQNGSSRRRAMLQQSDDVLVGSLANMGNGINAASGLATLKSADLKVCIHVMQGLSRFTAFTALPEKNACISKKCFSCAQWSGRTQFLTCGWCAWPIAMPLNFLDTNSFSFHAAAPQMLHSIFRGQCCPPALYLMQHITISHCLSKL